MKTYTRQEGMTMWGMVGLVLIGVFFMFLLFKLLPPYMQDLKVGSAISRIANKPGAGSMSPGEIRQSITKMLDIENISSIDVPNQVEITPRGSTGKTIRLEYEREVPMTKNISVLLYFDHTANAN
jgi:hypothetical protein